MQALWRHPAVLSGTPHPRLADAGQSPVRVWTAAVAFKGSLVLKTPPFKAWHLAALMCCGAHHSGGWMWWAWFMVVLLRRGSAQSTEAAVIGASVSSLAGLSGSGSPRPRRPALSPCGCKPPLQHQPSQEPPPMLPLLPLLPSSPHAPPLWQGPARGLQVCDTWLGAPCRSCACRYSGRSG